MTEISQSGIVFNIPNKIINLQPFIYRCRSCDTNLTSNTPANQYQRLKLIQNTVRVASSLYTSNIAPLEAYKKPTAQTYGVCWNQMSDRPIPSVQRVTVPTGYNNSLNRRHSSVTSSKPGSQTPGGVGCDIKHNSYDRYLNRLKGKGPLRRGSVPITFGKPIPFNPAYPIYGGKTTKTSIVTGCNCPIDDISNKNLNQNIKIYNNPYWKPYPTSYYDFNIGDMVYAKKSKNKYYEKAEVIYKMDGMYIVQFEDSSVERYNNVYDLKKYFNCDCNKFQNDSINTEDIFQTTFEINCEN